jgi:hypothetical protein
MNQTITLLELTLLSAAFILAYALIKTIIQTIKTK